MSRWKIAVRVHSTELMTHELIDDPEKMGDFLKYMDNLIVERDTRTNMEKIRRSVLKNHGISPCSLLFGNKPNE